jgi:hypothetical protein
MSEQRHPDATALAEYQAGLAGGRRGRRLAAHVASCTGCASVSDQLAAVSSALASAAVPPLPDAVERRITAALAAEAAPATEGTRHVTPRQSRGDGPLRPARPRSRRGIWRIRPAVLISAAAACLVLFGVVYLLGPGHSPAGPASSSAAGSSASSPAAGAAAPLPAAGSKAVPGREPAFSEGRPAFLVTASGNRYERATLAAQVRAELAARSAGGPGSPTAPSAALAACVLHLTGNVPPTLVDWATYQGKPAYVIAVADHAWVVGPDCTASHPDVITSTGL